MSIRLGTRRQFLCSSAAASLAVVFRSAAQDQATLARRQPDGLRAACSSLAFSDIKWDAALEEIKNLGFRYAELAMLEGVAHVDPSTLNDPDSHAKKVVAVCGRLEIEPVAIYANIVLGDPGQFPGLTTPDAAARKTILAQFERVVACARAADIPLIRIVPGRLIEALPPDQCVKNACELLTEMHALVARRGLMLAIKNQAGSLAQDPLHTHRMLEAVPGLRLDYDLGNVVANQYSLEQTEPLMKSVTHVSVTNARPGAQSVPLDEGELSYPIRPFFDNLRHAKVSAYVSVDYTGPNQRSNVTGLKAIFERENVSLS